MKLIISFAFVASEEEESQMIFSVVLSAFAEIAWLARICVASFSDVWNVTKTKLYMSFAHNFDLF